MSGLNLRGSLRTKRFVWFHSKVRNLASARSCTYLIIMNDSMLPQLRKAIRQVVRKAAEPGGDIDNEEFTLAIARAQVTRMLRLVDGALDGSWKKVVKEEVNKALVSLYPA